MILTIALGILGIFFLSQTLLPLIWPHRFIYFWLPRYIEWEEHKETYKQALDFVERKRKWMEKVTKLKQNTNEEISLIRIDESIFPK